MFIQENFKQDKWNGFFLMVASDPNARSPNPEKVGTDTYFKASVTKAT